MSVAQGWRARRRGRQLSSTDPVEFAVEALGIRPWERQAELLRAIAEHHRVACRSGHKTGKSASAVMIALWFYHTFQMARVIVTATTNPQIRNIFWRELRIRTAAARIPFPHVPDLPGIGMRSADGTKEIVGLSTKESERMAGFSGANMLFIVDEASGVAEDIFEAIEGNLAGGAWVLMLGNPTQPVGTFKDAFTHEGGSWHTLHISSWEAARSKLHAPGLATTSWCEEKLAGWGENDPRYQVRVEGNFADSSEMNVVPLASVSAAQDRWDNGEGEAGGELKLGVDVARFGDDETVIAVVRGQRVVEIVTASKLDEEHVAALVSKTVDRHYIAGEPHPVVNIDACGVGLGVLSILRQSDRMRAVGVDASEEADDPRDMRNVRSQLWFGVAEWLGAGGSIPRDHKLESDLLAPKYFFDVKGRRQVEDKKSIKKRIGRSPDRADALALAVFRCSPRLVYTRDTAAASRLGRAAGSYRFGEANRGF